ncbi:hypothetical protein [Rhodovulum marinum]|uniref:Uncharacterized protein n=1 Tax=Rhodovulum marinum TaxID=320662 RepID=A0A4R2Q570_9RHOB|nr:hypothetical protein [Rhodovulum marinum]TCP43922.1 hypothetical protein EV662_1015 [Rhodovulum marinum]
MPNAGMEPARAQRIKDAIERALRAGFAPYRQKAGRGSSISEAARALREAGHEEDRNSIGGFVRTQERRKARGEEHFLPDWSLFSPAGVAPGEIRTGEVRRWIVTSAQDDTDVHPRFWSNLRAYATAIGAELLVGGFTYQTIRHSDRLTLTGTFREEVRPFLRFDPIELGPVLFCAEMNTLPTAARPLSGLTSYSRGRDAIFPHAKLAYQTAPAPRGEHVPSLMTTGAVTVPNYVEKKAGKKAEFHHILGATVVEVDDSGAAWCRQVSATPDGAFQDLDAVVRDGRVSHGHRVEAVTFGDLHVPTVEDHVAALLWGRRADALIEELRPRLAFVHDLVAIEAHSRHVAGDPFHRAKMVAAGHSGMAGQVAAGARTLREIERDFCQPVVIYSNHDDRLLQWAKSPIDRGDVENVAYWHRCNLAFYEALSDEDEDFDLFRWALRDADPRRLEGVGFVPRGGTFPICQDSGGGGIECGLHGDEGPNGGRGSATSFARMAKRITIGHTHAPEIHDGVYIAGITGALDQGYNTGPGSWKRAHVVTYPNGKRTIVTQDPRGRWRA